MSSSGFTPICLWADVSPKTSRHRGNLPSMSGAVAAPAPPTTIALPSTTSNTVFRPFTAAAV